MSRLVRRLARLRAEAGEGAEAGAEPPWLSDAEVPLAPEDPVFDGSAAVPSTGEATDLDRSSLQGGGSGFGAASRDVEALRASIQRILERCSARAPAPGPAPPAEPLPGERMRTQQGAVRRLTTAHEPHHCHGRAPVAAALQVDPTVLGALAGQSELASIDLRRALYVDTETTGLSGGTGTVPFLVGLGSFEDESFMVEQLLLDDLNEEPALMARARDRVAAASCLVTFNGKAYDAPLLATRAVMTRVGAWPEVPHVDLLHLARRTYRRRLGQLRLVELERRILGFERPHDIDGAEVPGAYWSFLRSARPSFLLAVIEHNLHDIVALAALLAELVRGYGAIDPKDEPDDQVCRALWALRSGDHHRVQAFARAVEVGGAEPEVAFDAYMAAATSARRTGRLADERAWLDRAVASALGPEPTARVRLERAKHFEHRAKDLEAALGEAQRLHRDAPSPATLHRVERLRRRLGRAEAELLNGSAEPPRPRRGTAPPPRTAALWPWPTSPERVRLRSAIAGLRSPPG